VRLVAQLRAEQLHHQRGRRGGAVARGGLDIGAKGPEEIALSVMAQIVQERRKKPSVLPAEVISGEAIDPICKMTVNTATARHKAEVEGRMYYFCCAGCKSKFLEKGVRA